MRMVSRRLGILVTTFLRNRITGRHPVNSHFQHRDIVSFFASPKMTSSVELPTSLHPPASVRGMTELKPEAFDTVVDVPCFEADTKFVGIIMKHVREQLLKLPNFKPVRDASDGAKKLFLLDPCKVREYGDLSAEARDTLSACGVGALASRDVTLSYANWTAEEVLRAVLGRPDASGFSVVGHILHLNLREHLEPYKALIGRVYLDKVKNVTCVVNKVNMIESTFRNFSMEVLAGEKNTQVEVKQNGLRFQFDFAEVYWNPRLSTEHSRVVSLLNRGDVLYDVFAGVGPFAVPAAHKGCVVFANDLNPHSFSWLKRNVELNKVSGRVSTFNLDGRKFIRTVLGCNLREHAKKGAKVHVCMNLPSLATEFLDAFIGLLENGPASPDSSEDTVSKDLPKDPSANRSAGTTEDPSADCSARSVKDPLADHSTGSAKDPLKDLSVDRSAESTKDPLQDLSVNDSAGSAKDPSAREPSKGSSKALPERGKPVVRVHCYCFVKEEDRFGEARKKVEEGLGSPIGSDAEVKLVRSVAPNKDMMRVTFDVPSEVLLGDVGSPPTKRSKLEQGETDGTVGCGS